MLRSPERNICGMVSEAYAPAKKDTLAFFFVGKSVVKLVAAERVSPGQMRILGVLSSFDIDAKIVHWLGSAAPGAPAPAVAAPGHVLVVGVPPCRLINGKLPLPK